MFPFSYERVDGLKHLQSLASGLKDRDQVQLHPTQRSTVPVDCLGLLRPADDDVAAFNSIGLAQINAVGIADTPSVGGFKLTVRAKRHHEPGCGFRDLSGSDAAEYCVLQSEKLLTSLSVATGAVLAWSNPIAKAPVFHGEGDGLESGIHLIPLPAISFAYKTLHAGHLAAAIDIFGLLHVQEFPLRFHRLYHRGASFLLFSRWNAFHYLEESYLAYYKCLEYLISAKVLHRRGQVSDKDFPEAFDKLGIVPANGEDPRSSAKATGKYVVATRGHNVAHFLPGMENSSVSVENVLELKGLLDFAIRAFVAKR